jgi:hypothetical protein
VYGLVAVDSGRVTGGAYAALIISGWALIYASEASALQERGRA